ncbi:MAG: FtsX-like permease family protein [Candidatus Acidiferrales bacterium]
MFLRIVAESFARSPRRKLITGAALALGMAVATATLTVALSVGDRLAAEFRSLGANLLVTPKADTLPLEVGGVDYRPVNAGAYLPVDDLPKLKQIFWRNNIVGFTPFLDVPVFLGDLEPSLDAVVPSSSTTLIGTWVRHSLDIGNGESFETGVAITHPWWKIQSGGRWFGESAPNQNVTDADVNSPECVVGAKLAKREGIRVGKIVWVGTGLGSSKGLHVAGIVTTGGPEDEAILVPLWFAQQLANQPGNFRKLTVSAVVKPDDALGRRDPATMTPDEVERWSCSAYISSIAANIKEALPGVEVQPIRQVSEGESRILGRISALFWVVTISALAAAGLAVGATAATAVLERQKEVALMKALGASKFLVGSLFLGEQILLAILGGGLGYAIGILFARWLSLSVFGVAAPAKAILLPVALGLAIFIALAGSLYPLRRAARFDPAPILRGE